MSLLTSEQQGNESCLESVGSDLIGYQETKRCSCQKPSIRNSPRVSESHQFYQTLQLQFLLHVFLFAKGIRSCDHNLPLNNKLNSPDGKITHNPAVNNTAAGPSCPCSSSWRKISHISLDSLSPEANLHQGKVLSMQITRNYL